jgi:hypothetical protein
MDNEPTLRKIFDFDDSDLKANHQGRISNRQKQRLAWRRFFPPRWWWDWLMSFVFVIIVFPPLVLLVMEGNIALVSRFGGLVCLVVLVYSWLNFPTFKAFLPRSRDMQAERVECLYGRVLHLPNNRVLVSARKIGPLTTAEQLAFEHNAYYMVYIAPHSGDILAAEIAEKPKYDED